MQKKTYTFFIMVLAAMLWCTPIIAQNNANESVLPVTVKIEPLPGENVPFNYSDNGRALLYDNGPLITNAGGGFGGADLSALQSALGLTIYGFGDQISASNSMADDFTNTETWSVEELHFFTYQTGSTTTSTINDARVQIWSGDPSAGGTVIWGNLTTNVYTSSAFSNIYRALDTDPTNSQRPIMEVVVSVSPALELAPGTYWVQWMLGGTLASGPWAPPISIVGQTVTGNGMQSLAGTWQPALDGSFQQGLPFLVYGEAGPPTGPGPATNPNPADGATNVGIDANLSWDNAAGATSIEIFWGTSPGSLASVYSGAPITNFDPGTMSYSTTYYWRVNQTDGSGTTTSPIWNFTTEMDPQMFVWVDDFEGGLGDWTITNDGGTCVWEIFFPPYPNAYVLPAGAGGGLLCADVDECGSGTTLLSTATITNPFDFSSYMQVHIEFDQDFNAINAADEGYVEVSTDGSNWTAVWQQIGVDLTGTHEDVDISSIAAMQDQVWVRFRSVQPGWDWWWVVDNVSLVAWEIIPVELTSFTAVSNINNVTLNWSTATELNNSGFQVERKSASSDWTVLGFVEGNGTTTRLSQYSYTDKQLAAGSYSYRLKQVDFNGVFEYSPVVNVEVNVPSVYSLDQNYPNPFNPSTSINFSLAVDSKVTLTIFDVLGQKVMTLVNGNLAAGSHTANFSAAGLNSGVYFYQIEANGVDGTEFNSVKKMILNK
jgi:hypothetical protein